MSTTVLFHDGFDYYASGQGFAKWATVDPSNSIVTPGRLGGKCLGLSANGGLVRQMCVIPSTTQIGVGCAFNAQGSPTLAQIFQITPDISLSFDYVNNRLTFVYWNGTAAVTVHTPIGSVPGTGWFFVELLCTISTTTSGAYQVNINSQTSISASGIITSASNSTTSVILNGVNTGETATLWDDFYIASGGLLGDVRVVALVPTGAGQTTQFTPNGAAANWQCVSEVPSDGDTTYVSDATAGQLDLYTISALPTGTATVLSVAVSAYSRKDDSAARVIGLGVGNGTTSHFDATGSALATSYEYQDLYFGGTNPLTSAAWTTADFATLQVGAKVIS